MDLKLEFPSEKHEEMYNKSIQNWKKEEKTSSPPRIFAGENFNEFLKIIENDIHNNEYGVNSHLFFLIENNEILGAIQIRHHINHPYLIESGGHIGYGIAPKYRRKGYATKMLALGLIEAKKLGLNKVLLVCYTDNIGSKKVIENNGGIFERLNEEGTRRRYWIKL